MNFLTGPYFSAKNNRLSIKKARSPLPAQFSFFFPTIGFGSISAWKPKIKSFRRLQSFSFRAQCVRNENAWRPRWSGSEKGVYWSGMQQNSEQCFMGCFRFRLFWSSERRCYFLPQGPLFTLFCLYSQPLS